MTTTEGGSTTLFRYDGGDCYQELNAANGSLKVEFVRGSGLGGGIGSILYSDRTAAEGPVEHFAYNAVGHTVALTDDAGAATKTDLYEAFGNIDSSYGSSDNNRLANTKERSAALGLDNHGFRYYDPEIGRYLTRDPIGYADGLNVYLYVGNNPINGIDPQGLGVVHIGPNQNNTCAVAKSFFTGWGEGIADDFASGEALNNLNRAAGAELKMIAGAAQATVGAGLAVGSGGLAAGAGYALGLDGTSRFAGGLTDYGSLITSVPLPNGDVVGKLAAQVPGGTLARDSVGMVGTMAAGGAIAAGQATAVAAEQQAALRSATLPEASAARTPLLGEAALKGVGDDMLVHFSQAGKRAAIVQGGVQGQGGASYFFRVGDVKGLTPAQARMAAGEVAAAGADNSLAVVVSPNAARFAREVVDRFPEYVPAEATVPWTLIREVPGGRP